MRLYVVFQNSPYQDPPISPTSSLHCKLPIPSIITYSTHLFLFFTIHPTTTPSPPSLPIAINPLHHRGPATNTAKVREPQRICRIGIRHTTSKPTPTIPRLRNNRSRALSRVEPAAPLLAIRVAGARGRNELCARCNRGGSRDDGGSVVDGSCVVVARGGVVVVAGDAVQRVVIRRRVPKSTALAALLGHERGRALAGREAAAARGAGGVGRAGTGDELGALGGDVEGGEGEDEEGLEDRGHCIGLYWKGCMVLIVGLIDLGWKGPA
jgi:hypothetical protein